MAGRAGRRGKDTMGHVVRREGREGRREGGRKRLTKKR
jgi:superfamily II RNA helicase